MADESTLKIECAKLQSNIKLMEDELAQLETSKARHASSSEAGRTRLIEQEKRRFADRQLADKEKICQTCGAMSQRASDLLDTFPDMASKEFGGRYEIKDLEAQLEELYPKEFLANYRCSNPIVFKDEGAAYTAYAYVERNVVRLSQGTASGSLFTNITSLLDRICASDGALGKVSLGFVAIFMLTFILAPFLFLTVFSIVGVASMVHGAFVNSLFKNLYSVKMFLNNVYDEDIFQDDKTDIMEGVDEFLDTTELDYCAEVDARQFVMNPKLLEDYDKQVKEAAENLEARILSKRQQIDDSKNKCAGLLAELDVAIKKREEAAKKAYTDYLDTITWKHEWMNTVLLDVTKDNRVIGCKWLQGNTLYYGKHLDYLQQFQHLAVYQGVLHMHPTYCGQVFVDYKYMGGKLVPFSRLKPVICELAYNADDIDKKLTRIRTDIRARTDSILQSCSSIEDFNKLMATYGVNGESYVIVHICGLSTINNDLRMMLKNGPRVGYFFKLYLTIEELQNLSKEFPFEDIPEYAEVNETMVPRTIAQVRRMSADSA